MVSTVVFDFDGTLVDSNAIKRQGFFDVVAAHAGGAALMASVLARVAGDRRAIFAAYVQERAGGTPEVDDLVQAYSRRVDERVAAAPEMPGAQALLARLRERGVRLVLSSATPVDSLQRIVAQRDWLRYFDEVRGHPAQKIDSLKQLLERDGAIAAAIAVVGDGEDDRASAAAVGCAFFAVGEARGAAPGEPVYTLHDLSAVLLDRVGAAS